MILGIVFLPWSFCWYPQIPVAITLGSQSSTMHLRWGVGKGGWISQRKSTQESGLSWVFCYQGWSCCRKRTVDFSEFLNIKVNYLLPWILPPNRRILSLILLSLSVLGLYCGTTLCWEAPWGPSTWGACHKQFTSGAKTSEYDPKVSRDFASGEAQVKRRRSLGFSYIPGAS